MSRDRFRVPESLAYRPYPLGPEEAARVPAWRQAADSMGVTSRAENEARERAENEAWNAEREAHRTTSQRRARELFRQISSSAENETGVDYAPGVLAMRALDIPTFGLSDEIMGAAASAIDPELDYADAQRALDEGATYGATIHPWSARIGSGAGMLASLPLAPLADAASGATAAQAAARGARIAGIPAAAGGAVSGALRAPRGHRTEGAFEGALTEGIPAAIGGALIRGGSAMRAARPVASGTVQGVGYGLASLPGTSEHNALEGDQIAEQAPDAMAMGAGLGAAGSAIGRVAAAPARIAADLQGALRRRARPPVRGATDFAPVDEAGLIEANSGHITEDLADDAPLVDLGPQANEIADAIHAERGQGSFVSRLAREALSDDPVYARFRSVGITERPQIRAIIRSFGGPDRALAALREAGLARPGIRSRASEVAAAEAINPAMRRDLAAIHRRVAADSRPIAGSRIAEGIEEAAPDYSSSTATRGARGITRALRERADDYRYGSGGPRPVTMMESIPDGEGGIVDAPIVSYPPEIEIPYEQLRGDMARQGVENRAAYGGSRTQPMTPRQEAGTDIYRAAQRVRDEEIAQTLGPDGYRDYLRRNAAARASGIIAGDDISVPHARSPAALGETIASAESGMLGRLRQRVVGQYRDSVLATINEIGSHDPATLALQPRIVRILERASTAGNPIQAAHTIEQSLRAGTLAATVAAMEAGTDSRTAVPIARREHEQGAEGDTTSPLDEYYLNNPLYSEEPITPSQPDEEPGDGEALDDYYLNNPLYRERE